MNRKAFSISIAIVLAAALCACSDSAFYGDVSPSISEEAVVTKAQLVAALWGTEEDAAPAAECLAGSSFEIKPIPGFTVRRNPSATKADPGKTIITSSVDISFSQDAADGRGQACGEGELRYTVSATEDTPISIVSAPEIRVRHNVDFVAKNIDTPYPKCTITAYFERTGVEVCEPQDQAPQQDPDQDDQEPADVEDEEEQEQQVVEEATEDEQEDEGGPWIIVPGFIFNSSRSAKAIYLEKDPVECGAEAVHSLRMVINDFDCRMQDIPPVLFPGQVEPGWN